MHEEWLKRRDNSHAVIAGLATGRTVTSAACIMMVVFVAFTNATDRNIKVIGLGMATAIALDALIVRTMLVPANMHTAGRANRYLPPWLERRLPHLDLGDEHAAPTPRPLLIAGVSDSDTDEALIRCAPQLAAEKYADPLAVRASVTRRSSQHPVSLLALYRHEATSVSGPRTIAPRVRSLLVDTSMDSIGRDSGPGR